MLEKNWYNLSWQKVADHFDSDSKQGLSKEQIKSKREKYGKNKLPKKQEKSKLRIFLEQFMSPFVYILITVAVIILVIESYPEAIFESSFVFGAVLINAAFGFWEEYKASEVFQKLEEIMKTKATVVREGDIKEVYREDVVPGDIILLSAGDKVPADGRLIEADELKASEAALTGEWQPVTKQVEPLNGKVALGDRKDMVYTGALIEKGEGKAVVTATGTDTEMGKISGLIQQAKEIKTPLQKKLAHFSKVIGIVIMAIVFLLFLGGWLLGGRSALEMFETAVAIAVGGIPEALPIIMTLTLAIGMDRLAQKRGLVRKLSSVETLGSTSIICADKTKTLTQGKMAPHQVVDVEQTKQISSEVESSSLKKVLKITGLVNQAMVMNPKQSSEEWEIKGSPTDKALLKAGLKAGFSKPKLEQEYSLQNKIPFSSSRMYQARLYKKDGSYWLYVTGAPEVLLDLSQQVETSQGAREKTSEDQQRVETKFEQLTGQGLRVIGAAYKKIKPDDKDKEIKELVKDLTFAGIVTLKDPLREDVKQAIQTAKKAHLKPIIITGDYKNTAQSIAKEIGIKANDQQIMTGTELESLSQQEFEQQVENIKIYARAEPKHKMKIVNAWQNKGKVIAMTGDGVNDAPALKQADIGLALGSGTDVAKQASDLILLNDSFNIIVRAIREGRKILDNIRKAIAYVLADSFTSVILVGTSVLLGWPLPILWVQLLWNNIVEDTLPDIAYAFEPEQKGIMERGPSSPDRPLLTKEMKTLIFFTGLIDEFLAIALFWFLWKHLSLSLDYARTMVFGAISIDTAFVVYCYKNLTRNIWDINLFDNKLLIISSLVVFIAFGAAVYMPPLQTLLHTVPIGPLSWLVLAGLGIVSMFIIEATKYFFIRKKSN